jgi:hypothetical protein|tara:strand:+ start:1105 stop:1482 length:378 start_codon:yes stop_codon:yes gene_type:complete
MTSTTIGQIADLREVKRRLNIPDSESSTDSKIEDFMQEADNFVNIQLSPHATIPVTNPGPELVSLSSSLAAAIFNYWQTPIKDRNLSGIQEWKKFVGDHVNAVYGKKSETGLGGGALFGSTKGFK